MSDNSKTNPSAISKVQSAKDTAKNTPKPSTSGTNRK